MVTTAMKTWASTAMAFVERSTEKATAMVGALS
jgi:hypothetical protein